MNTDNDLMLMWLRKVRAHIERLIQLREKEIAAYKNRGFNPDDTTRKEED